MIRYALTLIAAAASLPAMASSIDTEHCVSVLNPHGCLYNGNINNNPSPSNVNGYVFAQNLYNTYNDTVVSARPDITLNFLGGTDTAFPGTFTGAGTSSGTWSLPGYAVNFVAVKAGDYFVLYQIAPSSTGTWSTADIPFNNNARALSHLQFFGTLTGAVPEPATWATMILGFGVVGAAMRRRRLALKPRIA